MLSMWHSILMFLNQQNHLADAHNQRHIIVEYEMRLMVERLTGGFIAGILDKTGVLTYWCEQNWNPFKQEQDRSSGCKA